MRRQHTAGEALRSPTGPGSAARLYVLEGVVLDATLRELSVPDVVVLINGQLRLKRIERVMHFQDRGLYLEPSKRGIAMLGLAREGLRVTSKNCF